MSSGLLVAEMTTAHFIYIPGVFILGTVIGYVLGGKAAESNRKDAAQRDLRREARRARRDHGGTPL